MKKVSTEYGPGVVLQTDTGQLGATTYHVKGSGFQGWFNEDEVFHLAETTTTKSSRTSADESVDEACMKCGSELDHADGTPFLYCPECDDTPDEKTDKESQWRKNAAWADVRAKALRIRSGSRVQVMESRASYILAQVQGDNGLYRTSISRRGGKGLGLKKKQESPRRISAWTCTCGWGQTDHLRKHKYVGRMCSHALALYFELQSKFQHNTDGLDENVASRKTALGWDNSDLVEQVRKAIDNNPGLEHDDILAEVGFNHPSEVDEVLEQLVFQYEIEEIDDCYFPLESADGYVSNVRESSEEDLEPEALLPDDGTEEDEGEELLEGDDIVARFQASVGQDFLSDSGSESSGQFDFAAAAQAHLDKTAGATYSFEEQQSLIDEEGVSSLVDELDLEGTHYLLP